MHVSLQTTDDVFKEYFPILVPELPSELDTDDSADESANNPDLAELDHIQDYIRSTQEESTNVDLYSDDEIMVKIRQQKENGRCCQSKCLSMFKNGVIFEHILQMRELRKEEKDMYIMEKLKCKGISSDENDTAKRGKGTRFMLMIVRFVRMLFCSHMALVRRQGVQKFNQTHEPEWTYSKNTWKHRKIAKRPLF